MRDFSKKIVFHIARLLGRLQQWSLVPSFQELPTCVPKLWGYTSLVGTMGVSLGGSRFKFGLASDIPRSATFFVGVWRDRVGLGLGFGGWVYVCVCASQRLEEIRDRRPPIAIVQNDSDSWRWLQRLCMRLPRTSRPFKRRLLRKQQPS